MIIMPWISVNIIFIMRIWAKRIFTAFFPINLPSLNSSGVFLLIIWPRAVTRTRLNWRKSNLYFFNLNHLTPLQTRDYFDRRIFASSWILFVLCQCHSNPISVSRSDHWSWTPDSSLITVLALLLHFELRNYLATSGRPCTLFGRIGAKNSYAIQVALEESNGWHRANHRQMFLTNDQSALMN